MFKHFSVSAFSAAFSAVVWALAAAVVAALACCFIVAAQAAELVVIESRNACPVAGAVIDVTPSSVVLLGFNGGQEILLRENVVAVHQYRSVNNPFRYFLPGAVAMLNVVASGSEEEFRAFPVYFSGNLIFFLDSAGKTRVLEREAIDSLQFASGEEKMPSDQQASQGNQGNLGNQAKVFGEVELNLVALQGARTSCPRVFGSSKASESQIAGAKIERVSSYRYVSDSLSLSAFFNVLEIGFTDLKKFAERSQFYARPLLFFEKSRLSLRYPFKIGKREKTGAESSLGDLFPLSFEKGGGTPFGYQGYVRAGGTNFSSVPSNSSFFGLETKFKAHALRGMFLGNIAAMKVGSEIFLTQARAIEFYPTHPWQEFSLNYMTGFGFDYRSWSLAAATLFPVYGFGANQESREILASSATPGVRLGYSTRQWDLELWGYWTNLSESVGATSSATADPKEGLIVLADTLAYYSSSAKPSEFKFDAKSLRFNVTHLFNSDIKMGASLIARQARYEERGVQQVAGSKQSSSFVNKMSFWELQPVAWARSDFGEWIALGGELSYRLLQFNGKLGASDAAGHNAEPSAVFLFEVLL